LASQTKLTGLLLQFCPRSSLHEFALRSEFVHAFQVAFEHWCGSQGVKNAGLRSRLVNGVAYAGFVAAAELLQSPAASEIEVFRFPFGKEMRHPEVLLSNGETC